MNRNHTLAVFLALGVLVGVAGCGDSASDSVGGKCAQITRRQLSIPVCGK